LFFAVYQPTEAIDMSVPAAFAGVILIWSTTPLAIQWSSEGGGFLFGVTARMVLGLIFCLLAIRISGVDMPWHARARGAYLAAGVAIYGAMSLVYWAAQYVPSGWIAVLFGLSPLLTSLFSMLWLGDQRLSRQALAGLMLGVVGLAVIFSGSVEVGPHVGAGVVAVLMSALLHAASSVWVKRLSSDLPALAVTGGGLSVAVPAFVLTWFVFDGSWPQELPDRARFAITYLALFGSVLGFFWYYYLLRRVTAVRVNLITLVTPVTALLLGHWLNGESILPTVWLGAALILGGLLMHQWDMLRSRPPAEVVD
jgi:drug/metabolite transporter (DMT)-like permease